MTIIRHHLTGFFAGEISPFLSGRTETEQYRYGLSRCENWLPTIEGPLVKRAGFEIVHNAAPTATWLTAFRPSITQEYVVEWGELSARFYTNGGRIETSPGVPYEIVTPYAAADAPGLVLQQNFDRQYLWHGNYPPAALRRDTATTFAHEVLELINGPFADDNGDETATVQASAASGAGVTLTASSAIFSAGRIGAPFRIEAYDFGDVKAWEAGMKDITVGALCHNEGKVYVAETSGTTGQVQPTHSDGSYYDGQLTNDLLNDTGPYGVKWRYLHDKVGVLTITAVASGTSATATVTRRLPDTVVSAATWRWAHGAFSIAEGWPHLGTLWKGRWIAFKDFDVIGSVVGDYGGGRINFSTIAATGSLTADMSFRRRLAIGNRPVWVARDRKLIVGTADRELAIAPLNPSAAVSGENIEADDQSFYGSEAIAPIQAGTETIFVERGGRRIRSADFDFARDRYDAEDLTASASHMAGIGAAAGFVQLAFQRNPYTLLHAARSDGQIAVHPKSRLEVKGFARIVLGGGAKVQSAVSTVGDDGRTEELWLLVERLAGDGTTTLREIWKQAAVRELGDAREEAFFVDGGVRLVGAPGQELFTGLTHLAGQDVAVLANGGVVPGRTVDSAGRLRLPPTSVPSDKSFTVIVGLAYSAVAVGLPPEAAIRGQSIQGLIKTIKKITLRLLETVGVAVGQLDPEEDDGGRLEPLVDRSGGSQMDAGIPLFTGARGSEVEGQFDRDGIPRWISDNPLPGVVTAAMVKLDVSADDV